jgi:hypothetical protein
MSNPPFNDSDTALRDGAFLQSEAKPQVASEAKDKRRIYDPACGSGGSSFLFCAAKL